MQPFTLNIVTSVIVLLLASIAKPISAATEFEDMVPLALVKALLANPQIEEAGIFSDIPEGFPEFTLPAGFSVLGGADQGYSLRVILQTSLDEESALEEITGAFLDEGFVTIDTAASAQRTGFVNNPAPAMYTILCHDTAGTVSFQALDIDNSNLISMSVSDAAFRRNVQSCAEMADAQNMAFNRMNAMRSNLNEHMPILLAPDTATQKPQAFIRAGSSQSGNSAETDSDLSIDWEITQVYQHFADQIAKQGWELDTESIGQTGASGHWQRSVDADTRLHGILDIIKTTGESYSLKFRLTKL